LKEGQVGYDPEVRNSARSESNAQEKEDHARVDEVDNVMDDVR